MKKFILVGGYPHKAIDGGRALCEELVEGFSEPIKLLDCFFARPQEDWEKAFQQDKEFFTRNLLRICPFPPFLISMQILLR